MTHTTTETEALPPPILTAQHDFRVRGADGRPSVAMCSAVFAASQQLARGCFLAALAEALGVPFEQVDAVMPDLIEGGVSASDEVSDQWDCVVARYASTVPAVVAVDVAAQIVNLVGDLVEGLAVNGVIVTGTTLHLPEDVALKVDQGAGDGLGAVHITAAGLAMICHQSLEYVRSVSARVPAPAAPTTLH